MQYVCATVSCYACLNLLYTGLHVYSRSTTWDNKVTDKYLATKTNILLTVRRLDGPSYGMKFWSRKSLFN